MIEELNMIKELKRLEVPNDFVKWRLEWMKKEVKYREMFNLFLDFKKEEFYWKKEDEKLTKKKYKEK